MTTLDQTKAIKQIKMENETLYGKEAKDLRVGEGLDGSSESQSEQECKIKALGLQLNVTDSFLNMGPIANIQVCVYMYMIACFVRWGGR